MVKYWKPFAAECYRCRSTPVEVYTSNADEGAAHDGDIVRCSHCGCRGVVTVEEQGVALTTWYGRAADAAGGE
jgi:hypothetical protein